LQKKFKMRRKRLPAWRGGKFNDAERKPHKNGKSKKGQGKQEREFNMVIS